MGTCKWGALLAALALTAAGCGGSTSEGGSPSDAAPREGKKGGKVTFPAAADVDYLDPGQTYYTLGYTVAYATNRPAVLLRAGRRGDPCARSCRGRAADLR